MIARALKPGEYQALSYKLDHYIKQALDHGSNYDIHEIKDGIREGYILPIIFSGDNTEGFMTCEMDEQQVHVITLAGQFRPDWEPEVLTLLELLTAGENRRIISLRGRKGWKRKLKPLGFYQDGDYLIKEVTPCLSA